LRAVTRATGDLDLTGVGTERADEDLHERRLAGPVLAHQAHDLSLAQREINSA